MVTYNTQQEAKIRTAASKEASESNGQMRGYTDPVYQAALNAHYAYGTTMPYGMPDYYYSGMQMAPMYSYGYVTGAVAPDSVSGNQNQAESVQHLGSANNMYAAAQVYGPHAMMYNRYACFSAAFSLI